MTEDLPLPSNYHGHFKKEEQAQNEKAKTLVWAMLHVQTPSCSIILSLWLTEIRENNFNAHRQWAVDLSLEIVRERLRDR